MKHNTHWAAGHKVGFRVALEEIMKWVKIQAKYVNSLSTKQLLLMLENRINGLNSKEEVK